MFSESVVHICAAFVLSILLTVSTLAQASSEANADSRQRGVSWVAGAAISTEDLLPLVDNHVNWIVQTPFGWQRKFDTSTVRLVTKGRIFWGETDVGLKETTMLAKDLGIDTLLKPHVWLMDQGGKWRGDIAMQSEEDWQQWFKSYGEFILHYAHLAEAQEMGALCVGTELLATVEHEADWRQLIREVRQVYSGHLTYAANWYEEFEAVKFWDALDFIGIQAYFPLARDNSAPLNELLEGWKQHVEKIERVQQIYGKPILFTEIGYRSVPSAPVEPWRWPQKDVSVRLSLQTQADCYQAFFMTFWSRDWLAGSYFWKWFPNHKTAGGELHGGFTPQNKPAEKLMAHWYGSHVLDGH